MSPGGCQTECRLPPTMDDACTSIALSVPAKHCILMLPHCTYTDPL